MRGVANRGSRGRTESCPIFPILPYIFGLPYIFPGGKSGEGWAGPAGKWMQACQWPHITYIALYYLVCPILPYIFP